MNDIVNIGVLACSDRASKVICKDQGGPVIEAIVIEVISTSWQAHHALISDDQARIPDTACNLADTEKCGLLLTTGGAVPSPRDVTPEATMAVCDKLLPGFGEIMRTASFRPAA